MGTGPCVAWSGRVSGLSLSQAAEEPGETRGARSSSANSRSQSFWGRGWCQEPRSRMSGAGSRKEAIPEQPLPSHASGGWPRHTSTCDFRASRAGAPAGSGAASGGCVAALLWASGSPLQCPGPAAGKWPAPTSPVAVAARVDISRCTSACSLLQRRPVAVPGTWG